MVEEIKRTVAYAAVDEYISDSMIIGIGSGSTVVFAVERIAYHVSNMKISVVCIPTSFQARQLIVQHNLPLGDLDRYPVLDICIDGADEVDDQLNCIKGGGGCHTQEKIIASCAKKFIIIADETKDSKVLGEKWNKGIPLEVVPMSYVPVMMKIESLGGKPTLRMAKAKMGPVVTDNGMFIVDADFGTLSDPKTLNEKLIQIAGVVETGLFVNMVNEVFIGKEGGVFYKKEFVSKE